MMAVNEAHFKSQFISILKDEGGIGFYNNPLQNKGVPDLFLACPVSGGMFIEVKLVKVDKPPVDGRKYLAGPTAMQSHVLKRLSERGNTCCGVWIVVYCLGSQRGECYVNANPDTKAAIGGSDKSFKKDRQTKWQVRKMMAETRRQWLQRMGRL